MQRLAGLAVLPGVGHAALAGEFLDGGQRRAATRRQVDVREAGVDGGEGVDAAGRQSRRCWAVEGRQESLERLVFVAERERRFGRGRVDHHDLIELVRRLESPEVGLDALMASRGVRPAARRADRPAR